MPKAPAFVRSIMKKVDPVIKKITASPPALFFKKYGEDQVGNFAAIIAYNTLFSMIPILLTILTVTSFIVADAAVRQSLTNELSGVLPGDAATEVNNLLSLTGRNAGLLGIINVIALLWSGSALFGSMELGFDTMFHVKQRDLIPKTLMSFGMIILFTILTLLSIAASGVATFLTQISRQALPGSLPVIGTGETLIGWGLSLVAAFILFYLIYWIVPNVPLGLREVWPGALLGSFLFVIIIQAFPFYAANFGNFNRYGALFGLFFLIMTWFYFLAQVLLLGAELNSFLLPEVRGRERKALFPMLEETRERTEERRMGRGQLVSHTHVRKGRPGPESRKESAMEDLSRASTVDLFRRLLDNVSSLIERQVEMAKAEAKEDLIAGLKAGGILIGGAVILFLSLISLIVACILALALVIPGWLSGIIFGVAFGIIGAGLALWGRRRLEIKPMQHTRESLQEDMEWAKSLLTSSVK